MVSAEPWGLAGESGAFAANKLATQTLNPFVSDLDTELSNDMAIRSMSIIYFKSDLTNSCTT